MDSLTAKRPRSPSSDLEDDISLLSSSPPPSPPPPSSSSYSNDAPPYRRITYDTALDSSNVGWGLLAKMGWKAGVGLGVHGAGRTDPIPIATSMPGLGLGKLSLDLRHIDSVVAAGRKKDSVAEKRELTEVESHQVLIEESRKAEVKKEILTSIKPFYCMDCDKQYANVAQYDSHLSSYDHNHTVRLKALTVAHRRSTQGGGLSAEQRLEKERKREEKEMREVMRAAGVAVGTTGAKLKKTPAGTNSSGTIKQVGTSTSSAGAWGAFQSGGAKGKGKPKVIKTVAGVADNAHPATPAPKDSGPPCAPPPLHPSRSFSGPSYPTIPSKPPSLWQPSPPSSAAPPPPSSTPPPPPDNEPPPPPPPPCPPTSSFGCSSLPLPSASQPPLNRPQSTGYVSSVSNSQNRVDAGLPPSFVLAQSGTVLPSLLPMTNAPVPTTSHHKPLQHPVFVRATNSHLSSRQPPVLTSPTIVSQSPSISVLVPERKSRWDVSDGAVTKDTMHASQDVRSRRPSLPLLAQPPPSPPSTSYDQPPPPPPLPSPNMFYPPPPPPRW